MPTYGYRCAACSAEFEVWQRMSDAPGAVCPKCGAEARRLFFPAGIVFKGAGFYATDSRNGRTAASSGDGAPKPSTDKAGSSSSEKTASSDSAPASQPKAT